MQIPLTIEASSNLRYQVLFQTGDVLLACIKICHVEFLKARACWQALSAPGAVRFETTSTLTLKIHDRQISLNCHNNFTQDYAL
jgi:hypothetical protein